MLEIGSIVDGKYKILNKIGQGGMSVVYLAMNEKANKQWAIKEVRKDGVQNYEVVKQGLIAETDMLKKLSHPNLPSIIDVIDSEDTFLIVMDYIEGNSLSKRLEESGAQSQEDVIEWAKQLCDVLGYLHTREPAIIYRDMKPSNVMLKPDGDVSLIDFGTAREFKSDKVEDTTCLGTRGYAAPEQFGGQGQTDARTDIYCLGATMYHLVTGHNPAVYPYEMKPIRSWNASLSAGLEEIILKCTRQNPNDRYQSCNELLYALDNVGEQDSRYRTSQKTRMGIFVAVLGLALISGTASGIAHAKEVSIISQNYDGLVERASGSDSEEAEALYREAIGIDNTRSEAYEGLLNKYLLDNENPRVEFLDKEEKSCLENLLNSDSGGQSNLEAFADADPEQCAEFLEKYVKVLMYDSGDEEDELIKRDADDVKAKMYLNRIQTMMDRREVDEGTFENVPKYLEFLDYKEKAGLQGVSTSLNRSEYQAYFEDLRNLFEDDEEFKGNRFQEASFYWDILIILDTDEVLKGFREAGIEDDDIVAFIDDIEKRIQDKEFLEKIETSLFWKNGYIGEGEAQTLAGYLDLVRRKVESGTDNSADLEEGDD